MKNLLLVIFFFLAACGSSSTDATLYMPIYGTGSGGGGGTIALNINETRTTGTSPLTVWYNATTSTDSAVTTPFMDLDCEWNFGDTGSSGTGTWSYGNPNYNSMNKATGLIASHTYVVPNGSGDTNFTASVTCKDAAGNTATGNATTVTVYDPSGANGYPTTATTCISTSGTFTGCPSGAANVTSSSFSTSLATYAVTNSRVLFRCGETFTGDSSSSGDVSGSNIRIGAYGGCEGTQTNRPILSDSTGAGGTGQIVIVNNSHDIAISDIQCEGNTFANQGVCITNVNGSTVNSHVPYQITAYNIYSHNNKASFIFSNVRQVALVNSVQNDAQTIGVFLNGAGDQTDVWTDPCASTSPVSCVDYQAIIGNSIHSASLVGQTGAGVETVRISAGSYSVITNNDLAYANNSGAFLKIHQGNTNSSSATWVGVYSQYYEISDNHLGVHGTTQISASQFLEFAPQDSTNDERLRYAVLERNFFDNMVPGPGRQVYISAQHVAVRNNIFWMSSSYAGLSVVTRNSALVSSYETTDVQVYNNTFYSQSLTNNPSEGIALADSLSGGSGTISNSIAKNNLCYFNSLAGESCVNDTGTGDTVSNNTVTVTNNPAFTNATTTLSTWTDYKPTANYTGAANTIPGDLFDALRVGWSPTWDLGAVHH